MIQFNLLPDVKINYLKAQRSKRLFTTISLLVSAVSLTILVILFLVVNVVQKQHLKNLDRDIQSSSAKLKSTPDLNKILTIQNQLRSLPSLHSQRPAASRLFGYITQVTPNEITISSLKVDFTANNASISGGADSLSTVNKLVDTLKFTNFKADEANEESLAFSNVVMANYSLETGKANYEVTLNYDPSIFDASKNIQLLVPKTITTRSQTEKPSVLFQEAKPPAGQE